MPCIVSIAYYMEHLTLLVNFNVFAVIDLLKLYLFLSAFFVEQSKSLMWLVCLLCRLHWPVVLMGVQTNI